MTQLTAPRKSNWAAQICLALVVLLCPEALVAAQCTALETRLTRGGISAASAFRQLGNGYQRSGQPECAVEAYRKEVLLSPGSSAAHARLGTALYTAGLGDSAVAELQQAIELDPSSKEPRLLLGVLEHDRGHQTEALAQWQEVVHLDPGSVKALDWIAKTRIESHQYAAAVDLLSTAPDAEDLAVDRVIANSQAGFYEQAIAAGVKSLGVHANWQRLRIALATTLTQRNRYQEAISVIRAGLQTRPADGDLQLLYLRVLVLAGNMTESKPYAASFLKEHPGSFDGLYLSGLLDREDGDYKAALLHLKAAEALEPDHFEVHYNLGATLAKLRQPDDAKSELEKAMALDDSGADVHFQLAGVLRSLNDVPGSKKQMDLYQEKLRNRALRDQTISLAAQASQRLAAGDAPGAIAAENEILKIRPDDAVHYYDLSLAEDQLQDFLAEQSALEHAISLQPDFAQAYNQLGYLAVRRNDTAAAEQCFRKAVASAPQYAEAESNLGSLLAHEGRDAEAEQYFRSATSANPRYTEAWINLAASLAARSKFPEARDAVRHALQLDPSNADAAQLLALLPPPGSAAQRQP